MLKILNDLSPFFEDSYRRINVREYALLLRISPPTASKLLQQYQQEGLLLRETFKNYLLFYADKDNKEFMDLSRIYWSLKLRGLIGHLEKRLLNPTIILFGSLSKGEAKTDSDIDLAVFSSGKEADIAEFEKALSRKIQLFWFKSIKHIKSEELANNIINGYILRGKLSLS